MGQRYGDQSLDVWCFDDVVWFAGDVLSGTWSDGVHHSGVMEEWFGQRWWTARFSLLLVTTLLVLAPLVCLKRVGTFNRSAFYFVTFSNNSNNDLLECM